MDFTSALRTRRRSSIDVRDTVLALVRIHMQRHGEMPTQRRIAQVANISVSTVNAHIRELRESGALSILVSSAPPRTAFRILADSPVATLYEGTVPLEWGIVPGLEKAAGKHGRLLFQPDVPDSMESMTKVKAADRNPRYILARKVAVLYEGVIPMAWSIIDGVGSNAGKTGRILFQRVIEKPTSCKHCGEETLFENSDGYGSYVHCYRCGWQWHVPPGSLE